MARRLRIQHEALVAIGALDLARLTQTKPDTGMAQHALAAVTGDAGAGHDFGFGQFMAHRHAAFLQIGFGRALVARPGWA